jgi:hypothetical protein
METTSGICAGQHLQKGRTKYEAEVNNSVVSFISSSMGFIGSTYG